MRVTIICSLLLATATLVSGEGGAITVSNNGTYRSKIYLDYISVRSKLDLVMTPDINPGETEKIAFPEGFEDYYFFVYMLNNDTTALLKALFWGRESKPINLCFKTWGTANDPQIGQTDCEVPTAHALLSGDGAAISVTNSATYRSEINLRYALKNDPGTKEQHKESPRPIVPGETKTIAIPKGAEEIDFDIVHPKMNSESLYKASFSAPVKLCFKIWGTTDDPKSGQIDC